MRLNSKIILAKNIKTDRDYNNVLDYTSEQMLNLCLNNLVVQQDDYSFIRDKGTIRVQIDYRTCLQANYIAFQNKDYANKWFFAWIDKIKFIGENCIEMSYTLDVWSTWFDNWEAQQCFVVREHALSDKIGENTIPENIDVGEMVGEQLEDDGILSDNKGRFWFVVSCNYDPSEKTRYSGVALYGLYPQGSSWFAWVIDPTSFDDRVFVSITDWFTDVTKDGHSSDIQMVFTLPYDALDENDVNPLTLKVINGRGKRLDSNQIYLKKDIYNFTNYSYKPKNNKCYVYPYMFLRVTNNIGNFNDYRIEDFEGNDVIFNIKGIPCLSYSAKLTPIFYKGIDENEEENLTFGKFPTLSWSCDAFTNWLTQNAVNIAFNTTSSLFSASKDIVASELKYDTGGVISGTLSAASSVAQTLGAINNAGMLPNNASGNVNAADVFFGFNLIKYKFFKMKVKEEYLKIIDEYFTRYGYKSNRVKVPNLTGRSIFNYVEIGSNEMIGVGSLPSDYMTTINNCFRKGVTIWHDHANIGNYSLDNKIK